MNRSELLSYPDGSNTRQPKTGADDRSTTQSVAPSNRLSVILASACLLLAFASSTVPSLTNLLLRGRPAASKGLFVGSLTPTPQGSLMGFVLICATLLTGLAALLFFRRPKLPTARPADRSPFAAWASAWAFCAVASTISTFNLQLSMLMFPIVLLAATACLSKERVASLLGWSAVSLAIVSIALAGQGLGFMADWIYGSGKSPFGGDPLAGPFGHSNVLGLTIALLAPFVFALRLPLPAKFTVVLSVGWALAATGSRTAWIAAGVGLIVLVSGRLCQHRTAALWKQTRRLPYIFLALIVLVPASLSQASGLTGRVEIWRAVLTEMHGTLWVTGLGYDQFSPNSLIATRIGYASTHGHNLFITFLARGGVPVVLVIFAALWLTANRIRSTSLGGNEKTAWLALGAFCTLVVSMIADGTFDPIFFNPLTSPSLIVLAFFCSRPDVDGKHRAPLPSATGTLEAAP